MTAADVPIHAGDGLVRSRPESAANPRRGRPRGSPLRSDNSICGAQRRADAVVPALRPVGVLVRAAADGSPNARLARGLQAYPRRRGRRHSARQNPRRASSSRRSTPRRHLRGICTEGLPIRTASCRWGRGQGGRGQGHPLRRGDRRAVGLVGVSVKRVAEAHGAPAVRVHERGRLLGVGDLPLSIRRPFTFNRSDIDFQIVGVHLSNGRTQRAI